MPALSCCGTSSRIRDLLYMVDQALGHKKRKRSPRCESKKARSCVRRVDTFRLECLIDTLVQEHLPLTRLESPEEVGIFAASAALR